MSAENVEIVRAAINALTRGDWNAVFKHAAQDFELIPPTQSPVSKPLRGNEDIAAWWADQQEAVGDLSVQVERFLERGDHVVALVRLGVLPHGADAGFELSIAHLWTMRDGVLAQLQIFPKREDALDAAGLSE